MLRHWEHIEEANAVDYDLFQKHGRAIIPNWSKLTDSLEPNTAVFVVPEGGGKRLEGIYDKSAGGIRPLFRSDAPNRDLRLYIDALNNPNITQIAVDGLMGTGKTSTAIEYLVENHIPKDVRVPHNFQTMDWKTSAERKMVVREDHYKIMIAKPAVNAGGEEYGFLPGDIDEKISPTLRNYTQYFDRFHNAGFESLNLMGYVEILPLGFIRGLDAENMTIVVDEAQNTKELITVGTREAKNGRIIFIGDTSPFQIDLESNTPTQNGLADYIDLMAGAEFFQYIEMKSLEHIVRSPRVREIVRRLFNKHGSNPREWLT